jgi:hypothetical protein
MTLVRYVLRYHFVGHVAAATTKIPSCPQVATPKLLLQMRKFAQHFVRTFPFQPLYQSTDRYLRWYRYKQMHMIFRHMTLHDRHFVLPTYLPYQISHSRCHFPRQRGTPILRRPYYMQMDLKNRVRAVSIFLHPQTLSYRELNVLKLSPKGEGFDPPKMRQ